MAIHTINLAETSALTFSDEFNTLSLYNPATGATGTWNPLLRGFNPEGSSNIWGHEVQFNVNPYFDYNRNGIDDTPTPFSVKDGVLTITAQPMDAVFKADVNRTITEGYWPSATRMTYDYSSGFLSTANSFSQTYGYFEMRAQLAPGAGMWSAFWLLPQDGTWPPELDVVELLGRDPTTSYHSVHSTEGPHGHSMASGSLTGLDATGSFHTYGLNWQSDYLTYYVDGQQVFKTATPSDMNKPMYMIANLAIGESGSWSGGVGASTSFPAEMKIDYIRAYSAMPVAHASVAPVTTEPVEPVEPVDPVVPAPVAPVTTAPVPPVPPVEPVEPVTPAPAPVEPAPADGKFVYDIPLNDDAALVYRIYQASFARAPDEPGFRFWYGVREEQGLTFYDMATCFRISPEFTQKYDANISNNDYVSLLYGNVLQRTPDTLGLLFWQDVLNSGYYDCNEMMLAFAESPENVLLTTPNIVDGYWLV